MKKNKTSTENKHSFKVKKKLELLFKAEGCCKIYIDGNLVASQNMKNRNQCISYANNFPGAIANFTPDTSCA